MEIGLRLHDTRPGSLQERLDQVKLQGFSCIQLAMQKSVPGFQMSMAPQLLTRELAAQVREELEQRGLFCAVLGCYLKLADPDEESAEKTRQIYAAHLRFARWIGARCVGTETPPAPAAGEEYEGCRGEEHYLLLRDRLRPLVHVAEEEGVDLALEPVCSHILHDTAITLRLLEELHSDRVRVILDAVNLIDSARVPVAGDIVEEAIAALGDVTTVLHMKDFLPQDARRPRPVACGLGQMDYRGLLGLAKRRHLPMTLENTTPENAQQTRLVLERLAEAAGGKETPC